MPEPERSAGTSDTALGDWYVNRIVIARQPLLLLVSARSLLSVLIPARDVKGMPMRLAPIVAARLRLLFELIASFKAARMSATQMLR